MRVLLRLIRVTTTLLVAVAVLVSPGGAAEPTAPASQPAALSAKTIASITEALGADEAS